MLLLLLTGWVAWAGLSASLEAGFCIRKMGIIAPTLQHRQEGGMRQGLGPRKLPKKCWGTVQLDGQAQVGGPVCWGLTRFDCGLSEAPPRGQAWCCLKLTGD